MVEGEEIRPGTGGAPPPLGIFIRGFLKGVGSASPSEVHQAYKVNFKGAKTSKGHLYRLGTYRSHLINMRSLARAGLIERNGRTEESYDPKGGPIHEDLEYKVYFKLTSKGMGAPEMVWMHPLRLWYNPYDWERDMYREYIREYIKETSK